MSLSEQADSDPYKRAEKWLSDLFRARTASQFEDVIKNAAPIDLDVNSQLVRSTEATKPPSSQEQLIIRPVESGGLLTATEFRFAKFCTEEQLKKRTSDPSALASAGEEGVDLAALQFPRNHGVIPFTKLYCFYRDIAHC